MREDIRQRIEIVRSGGVPEGYVGAIGGIFPVGWQHKPIKRVIQFYNKKSSEDNQYPILTSSRDGLYLQADYFDGQVTRDDNTGYNLIPYGYITFRSRSDDGAIIFNRNTIIDVGIVSKFYPVFTSMEREVDAAYLVLYLNNILQSEIRRVVVGSTQLVLSERKLLGLPFYAPSYVSQQQISGIILRCEHVISLKQEILVEKRNRKKWLLENLLDPDNGIRLEGFGGEWQLWSLGEVGTIQKGKGISNEDCKPNGTVSCVKYGDIYMNYDTHFSETVSYTDDEVARQSIFAQNGSLLFTCSGEDAMEIGKCVAYLGEEQIAVGGDIVILTLRPGFDPLFVAYQQSTISAIKEKATYSQGHSIVHLYGSQIKLLTLCCPPSLTEQRAIAHVLSTADREIDLLQQEIEQWQLLKKALLQLLLTGLVRV